ncbi:hypothetical protein T484DRAFT_1763510, partial [Baffinella frigidus]
VLVASVLVIVGQRLGELREKNPSLILDAIAERIIGSAPRAGDLASVVDTVCEELEGACEMGDADRAGLRAVLLKGVEANRPVPKLMEARLRNVLLRGLEGGAVDMFKDAAGTAVAFKEFQLPQAVRALAPHLRDAGLRLRKVMGLNSKVHAARYNSLIAGESAGLVPSRVRLDAGRPAPLGFRLMTVAEAEERLKELAGEEHLLGARPVRLSGGRLERVAAPAPDAPPAGAPGAPVLAGAAVGGAAAEWRVVRGDAGGEGVTEALVLALSPDKVALAPGEGPPAGFRLMLADEAAAARWEGALVEGWLEEWSVVRLAGGKIDGSGYGGKVTLGEFADAGYIGEALVVPLGEGEGL